VVVISCTINNITNLVIEGGEGGGFKSFAAIGSINILKNLTTIHLFP
jgi:hypothetical protein